MTMTIKRCFSTVGGANLACFVVVAVVSPAAADVVVVVIIAATPVGGGWFSVGVVWGGTHTHTHTLMYV